MSCGIKIKSIKKVKTEPTPVFDISVDKNHNFILKDGCVVHNCKPYQYFRSTVYEERFEMYDSQLLTDELIGLERDNNSGKIDHSQAGINSKDTADAVCGAMWNASQHADEYAFEYGEDIEEMVSVSSSANYNANVKQINVDFEEELKRVLDPLQGIVRDEKSNSQTVFKDFGFGKAQPLESQYIHQGIIVF